MRAESRRIEARPRSQAFEDGSHGSAGQTSSQDGPVPIHGTKKWAIECGRRVQPKPDESHGARLRTLAERNPDLGARPRLICLGAPQREDESFASECQISNIETDQLAAAKGRGKAECEQRTISRTLVPTSAAAMSACKSRTSTGRFFRGLTPSVRRTPDMTRLSVGSNRGEGNPAATWA
jgi:hypothetical protein